MCWRDDVPMHRRCSMCGQPYYGDLGHRNCPKTRPQPTAPMGIPGQPSTTAGDDTSGVDLPDSETPALEGVAASPVEPKE